jgi:hypothetical protein
MSCPIATLFDVVASHAATETMRHQRTPTTRIEHTNTDRRFRGSRDPLPIVHTFRVFVDGRLVAQCGDRVMAEAARGTYVCFLSWANEPKHAEATS